MKKLIKSQKLHHQVILSFVVSVASLIVDFGALWFFSQIINLHYLTAAAIGFSLGLIVNYTLSIKFVFPTRKLQNKFLEFHLFALIGIAGLALNHTIIWGFVEHFPNLYIFTLFSFSKIACAKIISAGVTFCWNFAARKITLFR